MSQQSKFPCLIGRQGQDACALVSNAVVVHVEMHLEIHLSATRFCRLEDDFVVKNGCNRFGDFTTTGLEIDLLDAKVHDGIVDSW